MNNRYVLDSYALLALLNDEPGAARVETLLQDAKKDKAALTMSLINLGELAYIIERRWGQERLRTILAYMEEIPVEILPATRERVFAAAAIKAQYPIAYADAFAAGLTEELSATLLTGDPEFQKMSNHIKIEWLGN
ncbi:type II toxin-antitoxin system VapC family toxin [Candidatus Leptofilum sp.]|uniref:type II toxin-antitoxin system VapC family toxin n=1 Tax=Candidatus Leptofilum sp. TaxID=3241576 RepID=UPI003B5B95BC